MVQALSKPDSVQMPRGRYLEEIRSRVVFYDGAMGTSLQERDLTIDDFGGKEGCNDYLVLTRPDVVEEVHASFLEVGCDVLETNTFGGSRLKLDEYGIGELTYELNVAAAQIARRVADRYATPDRPRFVAGSIGPSGFLPASEDPTLGNVALEYLIEVYQEQAQALVEGGCDLLLIETSQDILEVKAQILGIRRYFRDSGRWVPIQAQVTLDTAGRMLLGTDISAATAILAGLRVDVIGLNCSTGPEHMREPIRYLTQNTHLPISVIPNAGLPLNDGGRTRYPLEPGPMAETMAAFIEELGVNVVGGCCGTTPDHLRAMIDRIGRRAPQERIVQADPMVASAVRAVPLHQDPKPLLIGERVNTQGSRKVKRLLLDDDYDGVVTVARDQMDGGAHLLDVCTAVTERPDEAAMMRTLVKKLALAVDGPLMIDSTEGDVIRLALLQNPGRGLVNSINLENGRARIESVLPAVVENGAVVVALTIDEEGMAKTADRKLAIARRIYDIVVGEYDLRPEDIIYDALTFTLATGEAEFRQSAIETIEGIRRIKAELPGVWTSLGVSNVSFGLGQDARAVLNSAFLHHCVEAGLDMAIVNAAHIRPYTEIPPDQRELCDDLIFDRRDDALARFIEYFERNAGRFKAEAATEEWLELPVDERIHYQILHRKKERIEQHLDEAMQARSPVEVLNQVLLPAMKDVGDRFGAGELILPFVLQSAEVMKRAVAHLEQFLEKSEGYTKGTVVIATVYGDVHDIGKNLVNTILTNNGYTVHDLGKQVPLNRIIDTAVEVGADAIGLSALLVSTSKQMPLCVQELNRRGLHLPVIIGGAAINRSFGRRALLLDTGEPYYPGVFYAKDAFEGLHVLDQYMNVETRDDLIETIRREATVKVTAEPAPAPARAEPGVRSAVRIDVPIPTPPFYGHQALAEIDLREVFPLLDLRTLYRLHWGGSNKHGAEFDELVREEFEPKRLKLQDQVIEEGLFDPRIIYGYFPCRGDGNDLIVYDPANPERELTRFFFPRQPDRDRLCLADYFRPAGSPDRDVVAFQVVTVGQRPFEISERLQQEDKYAETLYLTGLAFSTTEALAEYAHRRILAELGLPETQGRRYSWGYPACPDLADQARLFRILPVEREIGVTLTESFHLVPEGTTAALVVHHPRAKYFAVRHGDGATGESGPQG